ncbi:MAG: DUF4230 domain-containing protein, partial [Floccifex sp.]
NQMKSLVKTLVALLIIACVAFTGYTIYERNFKKDLDPIVLEARLKDCSDLITQEIFITDMMDFTRGNITVLNKQNFTVEYSTTVKAGFDVGEAKVKVVGDTIYVTIPRCHIYEDSIKVSADDVEFPDTNYCMFDPVDKDETLAVISEIEDEIKNIAEGSELLSNADQNSIEIVKNLYSDTGCDVVVNFA